MSSNRYRQMSCLLTSAWCQITDVSKRYQNDILLISVKRYHFYDIRMTSWIYQVIEVISSPISSRCHKIDIGLISSTWYQTGIIKLMSKRCRWHVISQDHFSDISMMSGFWRQSNIGRYRPIRSDRTRYRRDSSPVFQCLCCRDPHGKRKYPKNLTFLHACKIDTVYRRKKLSIPIQSKILSALRWYAQNYSKINRIDLINVWKN